MYGASIENRGDSKYHAVAKGGGFVLSTDGTAPNPIDAFLASLCVCVGHYVRDYLLEKGVARRVASDLGSRPASAFASIKSLLRRPVVEEMKRREQESIREFVEIWYSAATWAKLQEIRIR